MHDRRKKNRVFHVNMLRKWHVHEPPDTGYWCDEVPEASKDDLPVWGGNEGGTISEAQVAARLSEDQCAKLQGLLQEFLGVFQDKQGKTSVIEHSIETGSAQPVKLPPYRLPQAYRGAVKAEPEEISPLESSSQQQANGVPRLFWSRREMGQCVSAWTTGVSTRFRLVTPTPCPEWMISLIV